MSDNWLMFIPTDPEFVPEGIAQQKALELLRSIIPEADEVNLAVTDDVEFIDPGSNWEGVSCPACGAAVDDWWEEAMEAASVTRFTNLLVITPCCGSQFSLNDLTYNWPAGFARFTLEALNPNVYDVSAEQLVSLKETLGCDLRRIWSHI